MDFLIGDFGHLCVIIALVSSLVGAIAYLLGTNDDSPQGKSWLRYGRIAYSIHALSVISVVVSLFVIIHQHDYRYHYSWSHSGNDLPVHYMISCFWEGQEGSFLLWIFWHVVLAGFIVFKRSKWEGPVMTVILGVQFVLSLMIVGVATGALKFGSSPFMLLSEVFPDAPIFAQDPNYQPTDGKGLNPLLQNYWMVIHPPTLFLGFALTLIPFAYVIAGLWKRDYYGWVKPAMTWSLVGGSILGIGIVMGGFWAYETLNFGGYWNWDPVENAVYVPWITLVVAIHAMLIYKTKKTGPGYSMIMIMVTYFLVLYSTFLTRSGVLGDSSVHSFTDLGLYWQLVVFMLLPIYSFFPLYAWRSKELPKLKGATSVYTKKFWVIVGTVIILLGAFQVIITTSIPFFNKLFSTHKAPPADAPSFYSHIQIWFAFFTVLVAGIGQFIWWNKSDKNIFKNLKRRFWMLFSTALLFSASFILMKEFANRNAADGLLGGLLTGKGELTTGTAVVYLISYVLLLAGSLFSILVSGSVIKKLWKSKKNTGGAIAHIGFAVMLIGILFSAAYSKVVSLNNSGLVYSRDLPEEMNTENVLLWSHSPLNMDEYALTFKGKRIEVIGFPELVPVNRVTLGANDDVLISRDTLQSGGKVYFVPGDTLESFEENMYYEVAYEIDGHYQFSLFPRAQNNPKMGFLASPDINRGLLRDLYTHVSSVPDPGQVEWSEQKPYVVKKGEQVIINDFVGSFDSVTVEEEIVGVQLPPNTIIVQAHLSFIMKNNQPVHLRPYVLFIPGQGRPLILDDVSAELGVQLELRQIDRETGEFTFMARTTQQDYIIMKVVEKPLINLLWIGTIMCMLGFALSAYRRRKEKDLEQPKADEREEHTEQV